MMEFGNRLKEWRNHRRLSQIGLAGEAGISTRHLSFLETGRSRPTEGMIIRLCEALDVNAAERNNLFSAAGFVPRYQSRADGDELPKEVAHAIDLIMENQEPYPAVLLNASYDILKANQGYLRFASAIGVGDPTGVNMLDLLIASDTGKTLIVNWQEVTRALLLRARSEAWLQGPASPLHGHIKRLLKDRDVITALADDLNPKADKTGAVTPPAVLPIKITLGPLETSWITTITSFGSARDALVDGLMIEQSFPADEQTRMLVQQTQMSA